MPKSVWRGSQSASRQVVRSVSVRRTRSGSSPPPMGGYEAGRCPGPSRAAALRLSAEAARRSRVAASGSAGSPMIATANRRAATTRKAPT